MSVESLADKIKEKDILYTLYCKEEETIEKSKIKKSMKSFFSNKGVNDLRFRKTPLEKLGKCIIEAKWDFSKDKKKKFCKTILITAFGTENVVVSVNNDKENINIEKEDWNNKEIIKEKMKEIFENPFLRSRNSFKSARH